MRPLNKNGTPPGPNPKAEIARGVQRGHMGTVPFWPCLAGLCFSVLLLISCRGPSPTETPTPLPLPTATPTAIPPTPTSTPRPSPTPIVVVILPTPTPRPTPTSTLTPTVPPPTPIPTPRPAPTPTPTATSVPQSEELFLEITSPQDNIVVTSAAIAAVGRASPDATVTLNGRLAEMDVAGNFSILFSLDEGINLIEVIASDLAGEVLTRVLTVIYIR